MDWQIGAGWGLFVHGVARRDSGGEASAGSGLLEAFVEKSFGDGGRAGVEWLEVEADRPAALRFAF